MALTADRNGILRGLNPIQRDALLHGASALSVVRSGLLRGSDGGYSERDFLLRGKTGVETSGILDTKPDMERGALLLAVDPSESLVRYEFTEKEITAFELTSGELINEITLRYAYDFDGQTYKGAITKHNPLSKLLYGEAKASKDLRMIQGTRQAEKVADGILFTSSVPEILCSFTHDLRSVYVEVGDIVNVSHSAGLGENGYEKALATVSKKTGRGIGIDYELSMKPSGALFASELVTLTTAAGAGTAGVTVTYENGVATITIYADVQGSPPVEGANVTIGGVKKITDAKGQVRFNLASPARYTAQISASGYEDAEVDFSV
jgi:hypothetical protein